MVSISPRMAVGLGEGESVERPQYGPRRASVLLRQHGRERLSAAYASGGICAVAAVCGSSYRFRDTRCQTIVTTLDVFLSSDADGIIGIG